MPLECFKYRLNCLTFVDSSLRRDSQNTKMEWYKMVPPLAQNSDFAEAWVETYNPGSSFYEDVSGDVIYGSAGFTANVQGRGEGQGAPVERSLTR